MGLEPGVSEKDSMVKSPLTRLSIGLIRPSVHKREGSGIALSQFNHLKRSDLIPPSSGKRHSCRVTRLSYLSYVGVPRLGRNTEHANMSTDSHAEPLRGGERNGRGNVLVARMGRDAFRRVRDDEHACLSSEFYVVSETFGEAALLPLHSVLLPRKRACRFPE